MWCAPRSPPSRTRSSSSGVYTADQAAAGEKIYFEQCAACHGDDLGGREQAPALGGGPFIDAVVRARTCDSCSTASTRCRRPRPRACRPRTPWRSLAFLLRDAQMPSGPTALPTDRDQLARITFERARAAVAAGRPAAPPRRGADRLRPQAPRLPAQAGRPGGPAGSARDHRAEHRLDDLRRQPRQPSLFASGPDHEGQLQPARHRLAAQDRLPRTRARHAVFGHAAGRRSRPVHNRRHAARRDRPRRARPAKCSGCTRKTRDDAGRTLHGTAPAAASPTGPTATIAASST